MSPQKKLMLRRNALFRLQLSQSKPCYQFGLCQTDSQSCSLPLDLHHEPTNHDNSATAYSLQIQPQAEH